MKRTQDGFTLIELMVVIAIIAILAALVIPIYQGYTDKTRVAVCRQEAVVFIKEYGMAMILETPTNALPTYTPLACLSATNTNPSGITEETEDASFIAKDTLGTTVACNWSTMACNVRQTDPAPSPSP